MTNVDSASASSVCAIRQIAHLSVTGNGKAAHDSECVKVPTTRKVLGGLSRVNVINKDSY